MTLFWALVTPIVIVMDIVTIVDVVRRRLRIGPTIGWIVLIIILPFVGVLIYWIARKPAPDDAEQAYLADASRRADRAHERF
jgi:hypothetical protein